MAFGSFDRKSSSQPMAEINMVPLIDVVLVLLVSSGVSWGPAADPPEHTCFSRHSVAIWVSHPAGQATSTPLPRTRGSAQS